MIKLPGRYLVFQQLELSMEHHQRVNINALPHSESGLRFELGLQRGAIVTQLSHYPIMLYRRAIPLSHNALPLSYPTIP